MTDSRTDRPSIIERAYQLARAGEVGSLQDLYARLSQEGYEGVEANLSANTLRKDLRRLWRNAKAESA